MTIGDTELMTLVKAIVADPGHASRLLAASPELAKARFRHGATRQTAKPYLIERIGYMLAGGTALHMAAAAYRTTLVQELIAAGADVLAQDRLGAQPIHSAAMGTPGAPAWNPDAQTETIARLIAGGADPNTLDKRGVTPLHRAVRTRCAAAVKVLLEAGADPRLSSKSGSTAMGLATRSTGRGGSGSPDAKAQQQEIVHLLEASSGEPLAGSRRASPRKTR